MPVDEYDRQARTEFAQTLLQLRTAQFWYSNVEEDAARLLFLRFNITARVSAGASHVNAVEASLACSGVPLSRIAQNQKSAIT
jgi:hypothetical protein